MTVRATSAGVVASGPDHACPGPGSGEIRTYDVTVSWSGFALDFPAVGNGKTVSGFCYTPNGFVSGATYTIFVWRSPGDSALDLTLFPDGFGPGYVFQFR